MICRGMLNEDRLSGGNGDRQRSLGGKATTRCKATPPRIRCEAARAAIVSSSAARAMAPT